MNIRTLVKRILPDSWVAMLRGMHRLKDYYWQYLSSDGTSKPPRNIDIELTYRCNARCRMCPLYGDHTGGGDLLLKQAQQNVELSTEELQDLLSTAAHLGVKQVGFTGGEPFLRKDIIDIIRFAESLGLHTECITNGTPFSKRSVHELVASGIRALCISVDGPEKVHDSIRGMPGMFQKIDRTIRWINEAKAELKSPAPTISIACTVSSLNQGHLHELVPVSKRWKADLYYNRLFYTSPSMETATNQLFPMGDVKMEQQDISTEVRQADAALLAEDFEKCRILAHELQQPVVIQYDGKQDIYGSLYQDDYVWYNIDKCMYPWYATRIDPYGNIYPCSMNVNMGNIRAESFEKIWNGEKYRRFRQTLKRNGMFPKCAKCCVFNRETRLWKWLPRLNIS